MSDPSPPPERAPIWQRRRGLLIGVAVAAIVLITVLSDLPVSTSRASDISAERSVMSEVNTDLAPCASPSTRPSGSGTCRPPTS